MGCKASIPVAMPDITLPKELNVSPVSKCNFCGTTNNHYITKDNVHSDWDQG